MTIINPNSAVPMYKQILKIIENRIADGTYKSGDKIPPEIELMEEFNVSRITIRAALKDLIDDEVLFRVQGKGTYVAQPKEQYRANDQIGFTRSCYLDGKIPSTKLLSIKKVLPTKKQLSFFGGVESDPIIETIRLRYVNDIPTLIETNHYPISMSFLFHENLEQSLFELMNNKYNIHIASSIRTLEICYATKEESKLLMINENSPLILFKDMHRDKNGNALWLSKQVYCTDHLKFYL